MTGGEPTRDGPDDLISMAQLLKILEDEQEPSDEAAATDGAPVPKVTRMPEGIEVHERRLGHAVGRWVLQVRCDCGRRWFEVEDLQTADCPRCGALVILEIEPK